MRWGRFRSICCRGVGEAGFVSRIFRIIGGFSGLGRALEGKCVGMG